MAGVHPRRGQRGAAGPPAGPDLDGQGAGRAVRELQPHPPQRDPGDGAAGAHPAAPADQRRVRPRARRAAAAVGAGAGRTRWSTGWSSARAARTPVDVLSGMAEELPVAVIAELLGVPAADRPLLRPWSNAIVKMYEYGRTTQVEDGRRAGRRRVRRLPARRWPPSGARTPGRGPAHATWCTCATPTATGSPRTSWSPPASCCSTPATRRR